jgi:hypothetical protein
MLCVLACRHPLARDCARSSVWQRNGRVLAKIRATQRPWIGPRAVTRRAEDLGGLLSNAREGGAGRAYPQPTALRRLRHVRDGRRQAGPRPSRDAIRQGRKCSACSRLDQGCRPAGPARLGCRGGKVQRPTRCHALAPAARRRQARSTRFARRQRRRQRRPSAAAKGALANCTF